jgi:PKD repeat protein
LLKVWDFKKTEKFSHTKNLSYHRQNLSDLPQIQEPLHFNTDRFDFLRIEGHQGKNYKTALEEILDLKERHGLAFDVKALSINVNTENLNIDDYECEFEDLNMLLRAWTAEQECVLAEVSQLFSGFNTAEPGKNVKESLVAGRRTSDSNLNLLTNARRETSGANRIFTNLDATKATAEKQTKEQVVFNKYYTKSNVIPDNLVTQENTLGILMKTAFEETEGGSVNDIIAKANNLVAENVDQAVWQDKPEMKEFIIDQSIELMAYTHVLSQHMPSALVNVDVARVDTYKLTLKELCALVDRLKVRYEKIELSSNLKALMGVLITHLSGICCSAKKLEILLDEINKRKENIIIRLRLSEFIKHHTGLEHKAGVEPGGTFVLVYLNKVQNEIVRDENLNNLNKIENLTHLSAVENLRITEARSFSVKEGAKRVTELEKYMDLLRKENRSKDEITKIEMMIAEERSSLFGKVQAVADIPNNTVVADFALPYLCCSDCAPVNFIIQKPPAWMRIEKDKICLGQETGVRYEVSPEDGEIQSNPEVPGMTVENNRITFNPEVFPDNLFGKPIRFTVNQQVTEAELTVFKPIQVDFEVPESPTSETVITFVPFGDIDGAEFLWNFGDGSPESEEEKPTHTYNLPVNEDNKVLVTLTVTASNGVCKATVEHEIQFEQIEVSINLDGRDFCVRNENGIPFIIEPAGANAVIEGNGVEKDVNGRFVFIPAKAGVGEHSFKVNGEESGLKVRVHPAPVAKFEPRQVQNKLVLENQSTNATDFVWSVNGENIERADSAPLEIELSPDSPTTWRLALRANSEFCGSDQTKIVSFETKPIEPPVNCFDETTEAIQKDLDRLRTLNLPGSNFVVPIWMSTSELYGGTEEFNKGVLNDLENFLKGNRNAELPQLFRELLLQTSNMIMELSGNRESKEYQHLVQLFALQLQLFYNVLGCQENEVLDATKELLARMFDEIISILQQFREREIQMPESFRAFLVNWAEKVAGKGILEEHVKFILNNNLV